MPKYRANKSKSKSSDGSKKSFSEKAFEKAVSLGKFQTLLRLIFGVPIGIAIIVFGSVMLRKKDSHTNQTVAEITEVNCNMVQKNNTYTYNCGMNIRYEASEECNVFINTSSNKKYKKGEQITIYYNPENVCDAIIQPVNYRVIGGFLIGFGVIIIIGCVFSYYMARRFELYGAGVGGGTAIGAGAGAYQWLAGG